MPCCGSVGGCGARAVSRKTPIYFMHLIPIWKRDVKNEMTFLLLTNKGWHISKHLPYPRCANAVQKPATKRRSEAADVAQERHWTQRQLHPARWVQPLPRQHQSGRCWDIKKNRQLSTFRLPIFFQCYEPGYAATPESSESSSHSDPQHLGAGCPAPPHRTPTQT